MNRTQSADCELTWIVCCITVVFIYQRVPLYQVLGNPSEEAEKTLKARHACLEQNVKILVDAIGYYVTRYST